MINQQLKRFLFFIFVSCCFSVGIGIGFFIRFGQLQPSHASTNNSKLAKASKSFPDFHKLPPFVPEPNFEKTINIQAVGDIIPGTNFPNYRLPRNKNRLIRPSVRKYLKRADLLFGNFESTLTTHPYSPKNISRKKVFAFRSPPGYAKLFADVGFDVLNIANNHAFDFGKVGFRDTMRNFANSGIQTVGHKNQILFLDKKNITVAMIGFAPYKRYNSIHDLQAASALVKEAKSRANIVVVSMHVGAEGTKALYVKNKTEYFYGENRGNSIKFARTMIDAGADLILGHGPHVPRAMEIYQDKLIAYSLGNFLGYRTLSTRAQAGYSMILEVKLNQWGNLVGGKIIPVRMTRRGTPYIDQYFRTVGLLRYLNRKAFPHKQLKINRLGEIVVNKASTAKGKL
ncbi:CapA family protein [Calothrix rhizosoleniae]|uniref:CapA family protein n=1 Tax=Calothrix rhizosoleniae TaxID=888997 RepID=UPI000B49EC03|nr:CapA family protein [Calothrix rhizosoleniae]